MRHSLGFCVYTSIIFGVYISNSHVFAHGESKLNPSSTSSPSWEAFDNTLLPPGVTILPPDWNDEAVANIPDLGVIQGGANLTFPLMALSTRKFYWFAGIPYADPESYTQENRFKPSKLWEGKLPVNDEGKFMATDYSIKCPQSLRMSISDHNDYKTGGKLLEEHNEECLVLNINTPYPPRDAEHLPVIVFLHGGSFDSMWSGRYTGHRFLKKNVLLVTMNYRLGLLGSLNLGIEDAPGNAALYDILTGLKWIKRYIQYFGGDKTKITVTGHSAGAVLATHLLTTDLAVDDDGLPLLHGIIGLSGSSLSQTLATCTDPLTHHLRASQFAGCHNDDTATPNFQEIRDCMSRKPVAELLEALNRYTNSELIEGRFGLDAKLPSLQDPLKVKTPFMTETPYSVLKQKKQKLNIPVMMGATRHDGSYLVEKSLEQFWRPNNYTNDPLFLRNHLLPTLMEALNLQDGSGELIHSLEKTYIGEAMYADDFESKIPGLIDIFTVLAFKAGAYNLVELNAKKNPNSYYFAFEYFGFCSVGESLGIPKGIGHMDSLFYLFPSTNCLLILPGDIKVSNQFIDYWVNFATHGNPNGEGPKTIAAPYNALNHAYLILDNTATTGYYCRDAWINNSIELVKKLPDDDSTTTFETETTISDPTYSTSDSTFDGTSSTTPQNNDSSSATTIKLNVILMVYLLVCTLTRK